MASESTQKVNLKKDSGKSHKDDPFFVKKEQAARELIQKYGLPKRPAAHP